MTLPGRSTDRAQESRWRSPDEPCLNCGDPTHGAYCPSCGQRKTQLRVSVRTMIADALEDQLILNRALPRTIAALLFRPGLLTDEYVRGRIVSYIAPFRLYLVASVVFFLILSFVGLQVFDRATIGAPQISADVDSARVQLTERRDTLMTVADSAPVGGGQAAMLQQMLAGVEEALALIPDTATVLDSATVRAMRSRLAGGVAAGPGGRQPWAQNMTFNSVDNWLERGVHRKVNQLAHLPPREALQALARDLLAYAPHMVFLLLPVFALLLKLLYIRRRRYYAEHFVFALHVHAFVFIMMTLMLLLSWWRVDTILLIWIAVYIWLAMKRVYGQHWLRTTVKWWALGFTYSLVLSLGVAGLAVVTLLLT